VDLVGFVFSPKSPRGVAPAEARELKTPGSLRVGVFVDQTASQILAAMAEARLDLAQLHGEQDIAAAQEIGPERVIRVFWPERHINDPGSLAAEMARWARAAALFLFDAGVGSGGHGRKIAGPAFRSPKPFFLAGGLKPADFGQLWPASDPNLWGLDFSSGLEIAPKVKDPAAIAALIEARAALGRPSELARPAGL
jgi:phosphoribosylanthranilate isomerase